MSHRSDASVSGIGPGTGDDPAPRVVLASGSATRHAMLTAAGVPCTAKPPAVDETEVKASLRAAGASAADVAETLAELKAVRVARREPGALVVGADQMLECDGVWFDKPQTPEDARRTLLALRGRTHRLFSAAVVARDGERIWHHVAEARLTMRPFSEAFVDWYLAELGARVYDSVGCYQIEGLGAQLFSRVHGDTFTILGLPLLPLLDFLRAWKVLKT